MEKFALPKMLLLFYANKWVGLAIHIMIIMPLNLELTCDLVKNLVGILAKRVVEAPPNPRSISSSVGSTFLDISTLSTLKCKWANFSHYSKHHLIVLRTGFSTLNKQICILYFFHLSKWYCGRTGIIFIRNQFW